MLQWEPPHRFVFAWQVTPQWTHEPDLAKSSEVEVKFTAVSDGSTRVDLEHRYFNRHGDGNPRSNHALPNIILGGTGGYFKMGRYLQLPATSPTKVLISLANAFGVNVPSFGEKALVDTSPLAGIAA